MNAITAYLIIATTIILCHSLWKEEGVKGQVITEKEMRETGLGVTGELSILSLGLGVIMEESQIGQVIMISAILVYLLRELDPETAILFNLGVIGLVILAVAEELIIIYIGIEIVGLAFYVLAARERKAMKSTEAGLKYFILGALSSGILLMGVTIVYAQTGTTDLELIGSASQVLIIVGLLFKVGAAPFHMWVPDVYEGAATIITTYFAVVPKLAYLAVMMKLGGGDMVLLAGILSILVGSIGAINQTKLKRMLAYSAIGHVGFMLIGVGIGTYASIQATIVYMVVYVILTVNSFAIIINQGVQKIVELRGLSRRNAVLGMTMGLGLMSIAGIPPLAGFYNKYLIVLSAIEENQLTLAIAAVILSVISSFYYVRIIRYMYFQDKAEIVVVTPKVSLRIAIILGVTTFALLTVMIYPQWLIDITLPQIY